MKYNYYNTLKNVTRAKSVANSTVESIDCF